MYEEYELQKQDWITSHPTATPQEYELAISAIAKRIGI